MSIDAPEKGKLIVLLGSDGAGKSTALEGIRIRRRNWKVVSADPRHLYPLADLPYMDWALSTHPRTLVAHMRPLVRTLFFAKTLAVEHDYHVAPTLAEGRTVVVDSYWYRLHAKEHLLNPRGAAALDSLCALLPRPDLIAWLEVPLDVAYARCGELSPFEHDGDPGLARFIEFQERVRAHIDARTGSIPRPSVSGLRDPARVVDDLVDLVERGCGAPLHGRS